MNILDYIPSGRDNAISREQLCRVTGLNDRAVRNLIKRARENGAPILSTSHGAGYWVSDDLEEIKPYLREMEHRCKSLSRTVQSLRRDVAQREGKYVVPVQAHYRRIKCSDKNQMTLWG